VDCDSEEQLKEIIKVDNYKNFKKEYQDRIKGVISGNWNTNLNVLIGDSETCL